MKAKQTNGRAIAPGGLVNVIMEIGQERATILAAMKAALVRGDEEEALERARELTGLPSKKSEWRVAGHHTPAVLP